MIRSHDWVFKCSALCYQFLGFAIAGVFKNEVVRDVNVVLGLEYVRVLTLQLYLLLNITVESATGIPGQSRDLRHLRLGDEFMYDFIGELYPGFRAPHFPSLKRAAGDFYLTGTSAQHAPAKTLKAFF